MLILSPSKRNYALQLIRIPFAVSLFLVCIANAGDFLAQLECHRLHVLFGLLGVKCAELHSNLKQSQRVTSLQRFRDRDVAVLFATDVAARGLDIKGVQTVSRKLLRRLVYSLVCLHT